MMSPGAGLGAEAAARGKVKDAQRTLLEAINAFPPGSKEQQALLRVSQTLSLFAREEPAGGMAGGIPPGIQKMNMPGGPPPGGPPGLPGGPPGMPGAGPEMPGAAA